ncbi:hypothetical protein ACX8XN_06690 [Calditrichota bacterium GD2]
MPSRKTIDNLNQEILDLKRCQVDMVKLSIEIFTAVSLFISGIAAAIFGLKFTENNLIKHLTTLDFSMLLFPLIIIILITPISFPIFMRIIIHKCRSIFRMVGYIRLSEEIDDRLIIPYEYGYGILRKFPIFVNRILQKNNFCYYFCQKPFDFIKELLPFKLKYPRLLEKKEESHLIHIYIGRYYFNLGLFLALLSFIHLCLFAIVSYLIIAHLNVFYAKVGIIILDVLIFFWCWYNFMLLRRYFYEIHYYPFSIYSWYCMFKVIDDHYLNNTITELSSDVFQKEYKNYLLNHI